jgi:hypothetical protein
LEELPFKFAPEFDDDAIKLRGKYLQISADTNFAISIIVAKCFKYNKAEIASFYFDKNGKGKQLDELSLYEKIEVCKKGLLKYYPAFFTQHEDDLKVLNFIRKFRNNFAHDKLDFDGNDRNAIWFSEVSGNFELNLTSYYVSELEDLLNKSYTSILNLLTLMHKIVDK